MNRVCSGESADDDELLADETDDRTGGGRWGVADACGTFIADPRLESLFS
jgi:hypothetical protein